MDKRFRHYRLQKQVRQEWSRVLIGLIAILSLLGYIRLPAKEPISPLAPVPQVKASESVVDPRSEKEQILAYIVSKFGDASADMITIIRKCENSTFDQSRTNHNKNGSVDYGVAQINSIHIPKCGESIKTSWKSNIDCAYRIYKSAGESFSPWSCSSEIGVKPFYMRSK